MFHHPLVNFRRSVASDGSHVFARRYACPEEYQVNRQQAEEVPDASQPATRNLVNAKSFLATLDSRVGGRIVIDDQGVILEANDRAARLMMASTDPNDLIGLSLHELFGEEFAQDRIKLIRDCVESDQPLYFCAMVRGAWSHVLYEPIEDAGNGRPGVLSTSHGVHANLSTLPDGARVRLVRTTVHDLGQLANLTRRELQILKMIGDGHSAASIADHMFRSKRTIQWHRASLGRKLGVTNRVKLAQIAYAAGLPEFDVDQVYDLLHNRRRPPPSRDRNNGRISPEES